jgi:uncharacterized protein
VTGNELAWVALAIAVASFAQSLSGFGFALLSVPLMTLVVSPRDAVIISTIIGATSTSIQAVLDRKYLNWPLAKRLTFASYIGMPLGLVAFLFVSETGLRLGLGVVVLVATFLLLRGFRLHGEQHHYDWSLGIVAGLLATSTSTNGPPLVFLMQARQMSPATFRATINTVFALSNIGALALFLSAGKVTSQNLAGVAVALPSLGIALSLGYLARKFVSAERFKYLVIVLLFLSSISVMTSAFTR